MYQAEVTIGIVTPMFSYGADRKTAEFRIPELKSLMRRTFLDWFEDEFDVDNNGEEVLEKTKCSEILFGSTGRKSPLTIRLKEVKKLNTEDKELLPHKENIKEKGLSKAIVRAETRVLILETRELQWLNFYLYLLQLSSMFGGLGKRSRKAYGSFTVRCDKISDSYSGEEQENSFHKIEGDEIKKWLEQKIFCWDNDHRIRRKKFVDRGTKESLLYQRVAMPNEEKEIGDFLKKVYFIKLKTKEKAQGYKDVLKDISWLSHARVCLEDFGDFSGGIHSYILGNHKKRKSKKEQQEEKNKLLSEKENNIVNRFPSSVCVNIYESAKESYLVIRQYNYDFIYSNPEKEQEIENEDARYVERYVQCLKELKGVTK